MWNLCSGFPASEAVLIGMRECASRSLDMLKVRGAPRVSHCETCVETKESGTPQAFPVGRFLSYHIAPCVGSLSLRGSGASASRQLEASGPLLAVTPRQRKDGIAKYFFIYGGGRV